MIILNTNQLFILLLFIIFKAGRVVQLRTHTLSQPRIFTTMSIVDMKSIVIERVALPHKLRNRANSVEHSIPT
jgi:hypothetical protein